MKVTALKQQLKRTDRYSIYIDDKYAFSLSQSALIKSQLFTGQELAEERVRQLKKLSSSDKLYNQALRYVAMRLRSVWEMEQYLKRKGASPALTSDILNKLSKIDMINDEKYAHAYISTRRLLRPTSHRKIFFELRQKHIASEVIEDALGRDTDTEQAALLSIIERKRQQSKYRDDLKLMQYLARQGFSYDDIKTALGS
jgi:regulatory protein